MKINKELKLYSQMLVAACLSLSTPCYAQFGGLSKSIPGLGGGGKVGVDVGALSTDLFGKFSPAAQDLADAAQLYREALDLKIRDNKAGAEKNNQSAVAIDNMEFVNEVSKEVSKAAKNPDKLNMSPEQKEKLKQAHTKLLSGGGKFVVVAAPTALAIKEVTDKDPSALLGHPELIKLAASCAKDGTTLLSLLNDSRKLCKAKSIEVSAEGDFTPPKN